MKRFLYILLFAALATACVREAGIQETGNPGENPTEGLTMPVIMHFDEPITLYPETRATAGMERDVDPRISSIHVAVFGWGGYLQDYITAVPCDVNGKPVDAYATTNADPNADPSLPTNYFMVRLPVNTDGRRTCHIIANGPDNVEFAYDTDLMKKLCTTDGNGGYWQWVYLENGILPERDAAGEFVLDAAGNLKPSPEVKSAFSNISLIRNFASVNVSVAQACRNFEILGWTICNMPLEGSFALYSSEWEASNVRDGQGYGWLYDYDTGWSYDTPTATVKKASPAITYGGFPANPRIDTYIPQTPSAFNAGGVAVASGATKYIYERAVTSDSNPFLLIEARYVPVDSDPNHDYTSEMTTAPTYYYRIDISKDGEYVPFYRNYSYAIQITGVSIEGYSTPAMAAKHNSADNFSLSLETATLSDVSDGLTRLYTEKSAFTFVYDAHEAAQSFEYDFIWLDPSPVEHLNTDDNITVTVTGNAILSDPALTWEADPNNVPKGKISYTLAEPDGDEILSSSIKIMGVVKNGNTVISRLVRTVTVVVFNKMHVDPKFVPQIVSEKKGEETTLIIPLYKDLPWTLFPLYLKIEDTNKTLNPSSGSNLPVEVGPLMEGEKSTFYYVYTLNYSEYEALNEDAKASGKTEVEIPVPMTTILDENHTTARVWNDYFQLKDYSLDPQNPDLDAPRAYLLNDDDDIITPNTATVESDATSYTFTEVKSSGNWIMTVSREHGAAATGTTVTPSSGSAGTYSSSNNNGVTVSFPANTTLVERKYIVTLTNLDYPDVTRTAEITQKPAAPYLTPSCSITSIKGNDLESEITINVSSNSDWDAEITTGTEYADWVDGYENIGSRDGFVKVRMKAINYGITGDTGRKVVVTFTNRSSDANATTTLTITQRGLYTSTVNSNSLTDTGQHLSASESVAGSRSITFSSSGTSEYARIPPRHYYVGTPSTFTASGSGDDFCSIKQLTFGWYIANDGVISDAITTPSGIGSYSGSTWNMASTISSDNAVSQVELSISRPTIGVAWHAVSLSASYYYWE